MVVSKIDLLKTNDFFEAPLFQPSKHNAFFSLSDFQKSNDYIHDWIAKYDEQFTAMTGVFESSGFFGISALGCNPENNILPTHPRPIRVEDPLLWLLWKNGFIKGK